MNFDLSSWLDAKYALDSRSFNREVLEKLKQALQSKTHLRCLDLGSGMGAMALRLIDCDLKASLEIIGIDHDAGMIEHATHRLINHLSRTGYRCNFHNKTISAQHVDRSITVSFRCARVPGVRLDSGFGPYDLITAHQFMDLVPLVPAVENIRESLRAGGLFYSTMNYDGETALIPVYADETFETRLLENYDRSMEHRTFEGITIGGSHSGRRLVGALANAGFSILAYGSSDWNITPVDRAYRDQDGFCLQSLLSLIQSEAQASEAFDSKELSCWYSERSNAIERGQLGIIVHQLDILAAKAPDC